MSASRSWFCSWPGPSPRTSCDSSGSSAGPVRSGTLAAGDPPIPHPVLHTLTTGRAGTTLLFTSFAAGWGDGVRVEHEPLVHAARPRHLFRCYEVERQDLALADPEIGGFVRGVARTSEERPVLLFGNTLSHLAPVLRRELGDRLRFLHLHRDPVVTAASIWVKTRPEWWDTRSYDADPCGIRIAPFDPHARFVEYRDRWAEMSLFERILYQWLERHAAALEAHERMPEIPFLSLRSEDLFADPHATIERLAEHAGLGPPERGSPEATRRNATWDRTKELRPLGDAWRVYESHPAVVELAARLGHPLDPQDLERTMQRYQLPTGVLPWIRHRSRYWQLRGRAAHRLRALGVLPPHDGGARGLPPRPLGTALRETILRRRG
jgi:hypothetical protein